MRFLLCHVIYGTEIRRDSLWCSWILWYVVLFIGLGRREVVCVEKLHLIGAGGSASASSQPWKSFPAFGVGIPASNESALASGGEWFGIGKASGVGARAASLSRDSFLFPVRQCRAAFSVMISGLAKKMGPFFIWWWHVCQIEQLFNFLCKILWNS